MGEIVKPGWHGRGYLPHFDAACAVQHLVMTAEVGVRLDHPDVAPLIEAALLSGEGARYSLLAWCVMPDHLHVAVAFAPTELQGRMVRNWKSWITRRWNASTGRSERLFTLDYFDRFARTRDQAERLVGYVERNPVAARLVDAVEAWRWSSASARVRGWTPRLDWAPVFLPTCSR